VEDRQHLCDRLSASFVALQYFDKFKFIVAATELQQTIYPQMGVMVIPYLEDSQELDQHREDVNPPLGKASAQDILQYHRDIVDQH
jgi:hypothetical protein